MLALYNNKLKKNMKNMPKEYKEWQESILKLTGRYMSHNSAPSIFSYPNLTFAGSFSSSYTYVSGTNTYSQPTISTKFSVPWQFTITISTNTVANLSNGNLGFYISPSQYTNTNTANLGLTIGTNACASGGNTPSAPQTLTVTGQTSSTYVLNNLVSNTVTTTVRELVTGTVQYYNAVSNTWVTMVTPMAGMLSTSTRYMGLYTFYSGSVTVYGTIGPDPAGLP